MNIKTLREARQTLAQTVDECQKGRVLLTRNGKPVAVLIGVEGHELEDVLLTANSSFWRMLKSSFEDPRPRRSLEEVRRRLRQRRGGVARKSGKKT